MKQDLKKYEYVYCHIEDLIKKAIIKEGEKVPSIRKTAKALGVSILTVIEGYNRLEVAGLIYSRPQSGYFVQDKMLWNQKSDAKAPDATVDRLSKTAKKTKLSDHVDALIEAINQKNMIKLGGGLPNVSFFPSKELGRHMSRVIRNQPVGSNAYSLTRGNEKLRAEISRQLLRGAASISPDELIVTSGATLSIALSLSSVCQPGDTIAIESPGFFGFYGTAEFFNLSVIEIPSDPTTGLCLQHFEAIAEKYPEIKCVLLCSNNSNPNGSTMPDENKEKLTDIAKKHDICVIEDETYAELSYAPQRSKSLKAFDSQNVISFGSFNKILAPGYRIGWIAGGKYDATILKNFNALFLSIPLVNQLALASFLQEEGLIKHTRRIKKKYEANMSIFKTSLLEYFPRVIKMSNSSGGHFIWIELPIGCDSEKLADTAIKHNISIAPGVMFSGCNNHRRFFRINAACHWDKKTKQAIKTLGKLISDQL